MTMNPNSPDYGQQLRAACQFMQEHDHFLVVSHVSPDGDAASSTMAVGLILEHYGKTYTLINEGSIPDKFNYLSGYDRIVNYSEQPPSSSFQYVISVDCADYARIGQVSGLFADNAKILNIDHHPTNDGFGAVNVIRTDAASTTEILFDLAEACDIPMTLPLSNCIYTGLLTDTGGFRYSNTSPKVMAIASRLLNAGVEGNRLAGLLLEKLKLSQIQLLKKSLSTLNFSENKQIAWMLVTLEDMASSQASPEDLEGLVNYPSNIEGVEVGILFKETVQNCVKVSLRSSGQVDVSAIAKSFGGGGHVRAAGCTVNAGIEQAVSQVVREVGQALR